MDTATSNESKNATAPAILPPDLRAPDGRVPAAAHKNRGQRSAHARRARRVILWLLVAAAAVAAVAALRPRPVGVDVAKAARGRLVVSVEETGMTRVKDRYVVSAPTAGSLSRLLIEAGDEVREGDVLAQIAPVTPPLLDERTRRQAEARLGAAVSGEGQARAQIGRAAAARDLAEAELARLRRLAASGVTTRQSLEQAEFAARMRAEELSSAQFAGKVAAEEVRVARAALGRDARRPGRDGYVDVLAPASGRVFRVHQKSEGVVASGAPLVEIGDPAKLEIVVDFLTTDAVKMQPGTPVRVRGWGRDEPLAGRVRLIEPAAFTRPSALGIDEQRVNVVIVLTEPRERWTALGDGYRVEAQLVLWQSDDVMKVPQGAVFRHGDRWATYRVQDGKARLTTVEVGHRGDTDVEILSGLSVGDTVAIHPGDRVKDGARVQPR